MKMDDADLDRVRAAKTPGWRHGTKRRPNPEKHVKAAKVRGERRGKRVAAVKALADLYNEHMSKARRSLNSITRKFK